jgi:hypothetical protein
MTDSSFPAWLAAQAEREARGLTRRLVEVDCGKRPLDRSSRATTSSSCQSARPQRWPNELTARLMSLPSTILPGECVGSTASGAEEPEISPPGPR